LNITIEYTPTRKQKLFHQSTADELLYGGAAGGGKTKAMVMDALALGLSFPKMSIFMFRRTFREMEDTIIKEAKASIPIEIGTYNTTAHEYRLVNGSTIKFRHCEIEAAVSSYLSTEFNALYLDELTTFTEYIYDGLKSRVRAPKEMGLKSIVRAGSNPGSIGHGWVKKRFVDPHPMGGKHKDPRNIKRVVQFLPATAYDNPHLDPRYIDNLKSLPDALRRAYLEGSWDAFEGQVFVEFVENPRAANRLKTHVIVPFTIPRAWRRYCSMDWGFNKPFSIGWWAVEPATNAVFRYAEWYGSSGRANEGARLTPSTVARMLRDKEQFHSPGCDIIRVADPHIWDADRGDSIGDEFAKAGVSWIPGDNDRMNGKMQLHTRLKFDEEGRPGLYVFNNCRDFIRTIPNLVYSMTNPEDVDTDGEDHIYDETRYFLQMNPVADELPVDPKKWRPQPIDPLRESGRR
jgi:phage terminase large subunit